MWNFGNNDHFMTLTYLLLVWKYEFLFNHTDGAYKNREIMYRNILAIV